MDYRTSRVTGLEYCMAMVVQPPALRQENTPPHLQMPLKEMFLLPMENHLTTVTQQGTSLVSQSDHNTLPSRNLLSLLSRTLIMTFPVLFLLIT